VVLNGFYASGSADMTYSSLQGHIEIARFDHWFKNVFVLPGVFVGLLLSPSYQGIELIWRLVAGLMAIGLVASSNYVLNEVMDAPYDLQHPVKCCRPVPSGRVHIPLAYAQWLVLMLTGLGLGWMLSPPFAFVLAALWGMGCVYNIQPVRSKDLPYIDVLTEAVNNPLRMLAGWFIASTALVPPASLLVSYWMIGCYFMAMKRFSEYRDLKDPVLATAYRKSFAFYTEQRLLVAVMFYGSAAMLFFGAFIIRYRLELIVSFPLVALVMAVYLALAFRENSVVQRPEGLYREPMLMVPVIACTLSMVLLWVIDIPFLHQMFAPTVGIQ
jgi:decaprenyl-phosphate phosphoribosyltransferase